MSLTVISYGGGVQSTAMLVLAAQGRLGHTVDAALFANVGDDSEDEASLRYFREVARPYASRHGIEINELRKLRCGEVETVLGRMTREGSMSTVIPARMQNGKPGGRSCTADFKVRVVGRWLRDRGASAASPATVLLGISLDEIERANTSRRNKYEVIAYPLLELRMRRSECVTVIRDAGLPVPGKSACWFCPNRRLEQWAALRANNPDVFERVADLEQMLNDRSVANGNGPIYMSNVQKPLRQVVPPGVQTLPLFAENSDEFGGGCDGGWCGT